MMKKILAMLLCLALGLAACAVSAEEAEESFFARLEGVEWSFSSGAGGWSTDMRILADGSFSGEYHDSEMGESADEYPEGTVYCSSFTGQMSLAGAADGNPRQIRVDALKVDESQAAESIDDGIRYVFSAPCGISKGDVMLLYEPGTPADVLSEDMQLWAHLADTEEKLTELPDWFLMSQANDSGFVGYAAPAGMGIPNPWQDLTEKEWKSVSGLSVNLPEGAADPAFRWLESDKLAEVQFSIGSDSFCFRAQPMGTEDGPAADISGMYFAWEHEEEITVKGCPGTIGIARAGSEDWAERCRWYDPDAGIACSLSVGTTDPDGLDLAAMAEQLLSPGI